MKIGFIYAGKSFIMNKIKYPVYQSGRALMRILMKDPENEIYLLSRGRLKKEWADRIHQIDYSKWQTLGFKREEFDKMLQEKLDSQINTQDFDTIFIFGEPGLGHKLGKTDEKYIEPTYSNSFSSILNYNYLPLKVLDCVNAKRFFLASNDKDFLMMPKYEDKSKEERTRIVDYYSGPQMRGLNGMIDLLPAYDIIKGKEDWPQVKIDKKTLFSFGFYATKKRIDIFNNIVSKLSGEDYNVYIRIAKQALAKKFESANTKGELEYDKMLEKLAESKYSLCIDSINYSNYGLSTRPLINFCLDCLTFVLKSYDPDRIQIKQDLEFFRVDTAEEIIEKIDFLEKNPEKYKEFLDIVHTNYINESRFEELEKTWLGFAKGDYIE